jgi:hypothetical protein
MVSHHPSNVNLQVIEKRRYTAKAVYFKTLSLSAKIKSHFSSLYLGIIIRYIWGEADVGYGY